MKYEANGFVSSNWQVVDALQYDLDVDGYLETEFQDRVLWCDEFNGIGRYYADDIFGQFYFERDEDRMMFLLKWGGND